MNCYFYIFTNIKLYKIILNDHCFTIAVLKHSFHFYQLLHLLEIIFFDYIFLYYKVGVLNR